MKTPDMFSVDSPLAHGVTMATAWSTLQSLIAWWWLTPSTLDVILSLGAPMMVIHPTRLTKFWCRWDGQAPYLTLEPIGVQIQAMRMDQTIHLSVQASVYDYRQENPPRSRKESTSQIWSYARVSISGWNFTIGSLSQLIPSALTEMCISAPSPKKLSLWRLSQTLSGETSKSRLYRVEWDALFSWWCCQRRSEWVVESMERALWWPAQSSNSDYESGSWASRWMRLQHCTPTVDEVHDILRLLRNNKAPGEDGIPTEVYKAMPDVFALWVYRVFNAVWLSESYPADWSEAILLPFFKKGDRKLCSNYREISLIDVVAKAFTVLILRRFQSVRDLRTCPSQAEAVLIRSPACSAPSSSAGHTNMAYHEGRWHSRKTP